MVVITYIFITIVIFNFLWLSIWKKNINFLLQAVKWTNLHWSTPVGRAKKTGSNPAPPFSNILASKEKRKFLKLKIFSTSTILNGTNLTFQVQ